MMDEVYRISVFSKVFDARAGTRKKRLKDLGFSNITDVWIADVYSLNKAFSNSQLIQIGASLTNPVTQSFNVHANKSRDSLLSLGMTTFQTNSVKFDWVIEIGFLPGVTDNVAHTTREIIEDLLKIDFDKEEGVYTSQITFLEGNISKKQIQKIAASFYNPLIQRVHIKNYRQFIKDKGMDFIVPEVKLNQKNSILEVELNISDEELAKIGKLGIADLDGTRRGPLALSLFYLKEIRDYFNKLGRNPTDIEVESLAQTWSEHCKHTIFADPIDEIKDGLFKHYIKKATEEIRRKKSARNRSSSGRDFCISVFTDNSGAIEFDDNYLITHKVETHNSPSALDPFGGAITGIVGVNRDTIGFGLGAKPIANFYGYCLANPKKDIPLYKDAGKTQRMLSSRKILDGVIEGVNTGGNQSGIPTPLGFLYFDERYRGKPLVFCGTVGLIPKKIKGRQSHTKAAKPGDYIVMLGGRVGKDGIHGATFSSEALDVGSPVTAVQIGDPITQKKLSDALIREARGMFLYNSITDNGAGGLSCSVAEMAKEGGGCSVDLEKVPLKYPGLAPWEIWVSEAQERMTLAVPKNKWNKFADLMARRGVEATRIGEFADSGKCIVNYFGKKIMDIDMQFLHYGLPKRRQISTFNFKKHAEPKIESKRNLTSSLINMVGRLNTASFEFISQQYDHVVLGNSMSGPLQGRGRVNGDAAVIRPVINTKRGVVTSYGLYPSYSDIDTYHMAAASVDTAVRNAVAVGADPDYLALLDNFCWCSSTDSFRLGQLKRAAKACFNYATFYETPFISGKDSMFNDFVGFDQNGKSIKISIPPTLLITSIGVISDVTSIVSLDAKNAYDLIYILGETFEELGGSEYYAFMGEQKNKSFIGNNVPKVDAFKNKKLYHAYYKCIEKELIASAQSITRGGLGIALAKTSMGGMLGMEINLDEMPGNISRDDAALFSESQGRILVSVAVQNKPEFERIMKGIPFAEIGKVTNSPDFIIKGLKGNIVVNTNIYDLLKSYRETFKGF